MLSLLVTKNAEIHFDMDIPEILLQTLYFAKRFPHLQNDGFYHKMDCYPNVRI